MSSNVLVLGARGRFGRAAVEAFDGAGWTVSAFARSPRDEDATGARWSYGDAFDADAVTEAARGSDVIVNALNPPYERWASDVPRLTDSVLAAARATGAAVVIPGNVYNYGAGMPPVLTEDTPHAPTTRKGQLREELEQAYRAAAAAGDVRAIVIRAGDFIEREKTGNWFDTYIARGVRDGTVVYPGPVDIEHAWAYLPDLARATVALAGRRADLDPFESVNFPGHTFTGRQLQQRAEVLLRHRVRLKSFPWVMLRLIAPFRRAIREVLEMRYLWYTPHRVESRKFAALVPNFDATALDDMLTEVWQVAPPHES